MRNDTKGFVALMSVIIIGAMLSLFVFTLGVSTFYSRYGIFDSENKHMSVALADACVNSAILKIAQNPSYAPAAGGECVGVGGECGGTGELQVCKICDVTTAGAITTIQIRAAYGGAYTNVAVSVDSSDGRFGIVSRRELPTYGGPLCVFP